MATSQHPMPHGSHLLLLPLALALLLFLGSADAAGSYENCPKGYKNCDKNKPGCETNVLSDPMNCGYCGKTCDPVPYADVKCYDGYCKYTCKHGWTNCDKKWDTGCEVNTNTDASNCGWCGHACQQVKNAVTKCKDGQCGEPECEKGWGNCDGNLKRNGCETDLNNDVYNCGECRHRCPCGLKGGEPTCSHGKCGEQCKKGSKYDNQKMKCVQEPKH